jgi:hypothetical protein
MTLAGEPFRHGDHVCALFTSPEEQLTVAAAFIADGLRGHERCLFAGASDATLAQFRSALRAQGIDADAAHDRGSLILLTSAEAHLPDGRFNSERMLRMLNDTVEQALDDGYVGLRTCGDMTWLLDEPAGSADVMEYEALVTQLFKDVRALGMCQYDARRLPPRLLAYGLGTHPTVVIDQRHAANTFRDSTAG